MSRNKMQYTSIDIKEMCNKALKCPGTFYKQAFINYRGKTSDTYQLYTEVVADFLLNNIDEFDNNIPRITRLVDYNTKHDGSYREGTGRDEEIIAIKMFRKSLFDNFIYPYIGKVLDYQTPLKSKMTDIAGKIDLLSYDGKVLRILEIKKPSSTETMLRCILEGYTYFKIVDKGKLIADFNLPSDTIVETAPLVFWKGSQWMEWQDNRPALHSLCDTLCIKPYFIKKEKDSYTVLLDCAEDDQN